MARNLLLSVLVLMCSSLVARAGRAAEGLPGYLQVGEQRLVLNGSGVRTKVLLELYAAGLYLTKPSSDSAAVMAADEPMALRIQITSSFVSQSSLVDSLGDGFKNATGGDTRQISQEIVQFRELFKGDIKKGDVFDMVYLPPHGVIVNKNGKYQGVVAGAAFKRALFGIWLCDKPADGALKQALLGPVRVR